MKREYTILAAVVAVTAIAFGAFIVMNGGDGNVTVADVYDCDDKMGDFKFIGDDGQMVQIAKDKVLDSNITIGYFGDITKWNDDPVVNRESNMVVFSTTGNTSKIDFVFYFGHIKSNTLNAFLVDGMPRITMKAADGFNIELYYFDSKGGDEISKYELTTYEFMMSQNVNLPVYYGDVMFNVPATQNNPDMMMFALGLELSSGVMDDNRAKSVLRLMRDMGYLNAGTNDDYKSTPTLTSTDVAIGSKQYNGYNLILVTLNGTYYTKEFGANVLLGPSGDHKGFTIAANHALDLLRQFIKDKNITGKTKILLTGYSRTAAGANLAAAYLSDAIADGKVHERIGNIELTKEDVYGFSFETPLCGIPSANGHAGATDARYDNIWYVINCDDPVTYVPPASYGFVRFGHAVDLPSHDDTPRTKMLELIGKYYSPSIIPSYDMSKFVQIADVKDLKQLWEGFFDKFFKAVGDRKFYSENIEDDFSKFLYAVFTYPGWMEELVGGPSQMLSFIVGMSTYSSDKQKFDDHFLPLVEKATSNHGCKEFSKNIVNSLYQVMKVVERYTDGNVYRILVDPYALAMTANYKIILMSHLPSMVYCYLVQDSSLYKK
jgi:hypothetical protein